MLCTPGADKSFIRRIWANCQQECLRHRQQECLRSRGANILVCLWRNLDTIARPGRPANRNVYATEGRKFLLPWLGQRSGSSSTDMDSIRADVVYRPRFYRRMLSVEEWDMLRTG